MKHRGVGIHCFAGGFTMGMKTVMPVVGQLEIHNFGGETCKAHKTKFMNADTWRGWDDYKSEWEGCSFCYGNPRCTSFSSYSAGSNSTVRGPNAKPTRDIWDLCRFGIHADFDLIAFESVQQAYTVGRPLLDILRDDLFVPAGYRIAHLFVNTAAEGNAQKRRRYFFVAYRNNKNFNVMRPNLPEFRTTVGDVLGPLLGRKTVGGKLWGNNNPWTPDTYTEFNAQEKVMIPILRQGESYHDVATKRLEEMKRVSPYHYDKYVYRLSEVPFSLHAPCRLKWNGHCPTIASSFGNNIHPTLDRPITALETAALMGWPKNFVPVGAQPIAQIAKGVVPATGAWLGEQIKLYLNDMWGDDDFSTTYNHHTGQWVGENHTDKPIEKVFKLTNYLPPFKESQDGK